MANRANKGWDDFQRIAVVQHPDRIYLDSQLFAERWDGVPQAVIEGDLRSRNRAALLEIWRNYLRLKYGAALRIKRDPDAELGVVLADVAKSLVRGLSPTEAPSELIELIAPRIKADEVVYLQRIVDLPLDAVRATWYPVELDAFGDWATLLEKDAITLDRLPARIAKAKHPIATAVDAEFVDLSEDLNQSLDHEASFADIAYLFCGLLAEKFSCRFVDFLEPTDKGLSVVASTSAGKDLSRLGDRGFYERGEGITGSCVLIEPGQHRPWVATEDLDSDLRRSIPHQTKYEAMLGTIHDYIVVPAFDGDTLAGAFRLVDRASVPPNGVSWPDDDAFVIVDAVAQFARHYPFIKNPEALTGTGVRTETRGLALDPFTQAFAGDVAQMRQRYLKFIPAPMLTDLIGHLTSVVHRRIEKRSLGCTIGVCTQEAEAFVRTLEIYPATKTRELKSFAGASDEYDHVDPTGGAFTWNTSHEYLGVRKMLNQQKEGMDPLSSITNDNSPEIAFFHLDRDSDAIRIYFDGKIVADYFIRSDTGRWQFRDYEDLQKKLKEAARGLVSDSVLKQLFHHVRKLSYVRHGALLVVAPNLDGVEISGASSEVNVPYMRLQDVEFIDLASMDGGVHIQTKPPTVTSAGLVFITPPAEKSAFGRNVGARHRAALGLSSKLPEALVIVVSENRPVSVMAGGELILNGF